MPRVYEADGVRNMRDLGGYTTRDGKYVVKHGLLLRSAGWGKAPASSIDYLTQQLQVKLVVDLRTPPEALEQGFGGLLSRFALDIDHPELMGKLKTQNPKETDDQFRKLEFRPVLDRKNTAAYLFRQLSCNDKLRAVFFFITCRRAKGEDVIARQVWSGGLVGLYQIFLIAGGPRIAAILKLITENDGTVLFHCSWGKDRTGVISALLLLSLGVSEEDVIEDFTYTEKMFSKDEMKLLAPKAFHAPTNPGMIDELASAPARVMLKTIELLKEKFGSVENYLDSIGFTETNRRQLRSKCLRAVE